MFHLMMGAVLVFLCMLEKAPGMCILIALWSERRESLKVKAP